MNNIRNKTLVYAVFFLGTKFLQIKFKYALKCYNSNLKKLNFQVEQECVV